MCCCTRMYAHPASLSAFNGVSVVPLASWPPVRRKAHRRGRRSGRPRPARPPPSVGPARGPTRAKGARRPASRPGPTTDPISWVFTMIGKLIVGLWMLLANGIGSAARALGKNARELDPAHRRDGLGLAVLASAIVLAAMTWRDGRGTVSGVVNAVVHGVLGSLAWAVPLAARAARLALLRHPDQNADTGRMVIGWTALLVGVLGVIHVANGTPYPVGRRRNDGMDKVSQAGGMVGFIVSAPPIEHPAGLDHDPAAADPVRVRRAGDHRHARAPGPRAAGRAQAHAVRTAARPPSDAAAPRPGSGPGPRRARTGDEPASYVKPYDTPVSPSRTSAPTTRPEIVPGLVDEEEPRPRRSSEAGAAAAHPRAAQGRAARAVSAGRAVPSARSAVPASRAARRSRRPRPTHRGQRADQRARAVRHRRAGDRVHPRPDGDPLRDRARARRSRWRRSPR